MEQPSALIPVERIERSILRLRGRNVLLDADLAALYGVETRVLVQAVKRNLARFPADFLFQLTPEEFSRLRSRTVISRSWGGRRYLPYAFTEQGVAMLSSVLNSDRAIQVNILIMRTFVRLRQLAASHRDLLARLDALEAKYDEKFRSVFQAIRRILTEMAKPAPEPPAGNIGFRAE